MIRTLDEVRASRERRSLGRLAITLLAVSQLDDIWMFTCNGPAIGEECPEDGWEPGDTSGLEDTAATAAAHAKAHRACYHGVLAAPVVHRAEVLPLPAPNLCTVCGCSPFDRAQHGSDPYGVRS